MKSENETKENNWSKQNRPTSRAEEDGRTMARIGRYRGPINKIGGNSSRRNGIGRYNTWTLQPIYEVWWRQQPNGQNWWRQLTN